MSNQSEGTLLKNEIAAEELELSEVLKLIQVGDILWSSDNSANKIVEKHYKKTPSNKYQILLVGRPH